MNKVLNFRFSIFDFFTMKKLDLFFAAILLFLMNEK